MKRSVYDRARRIIERAKPRSSEARAHLDELTLHTEGYAERGYSDPKSGVIALGNWNTVSRYDQTTREFIEIDDTMKRVGEALEKLGAELEWSDEWSACDECSKLVRTSADSYGWKRSYWQSDCGCLCADCVKRDPSAYLEELEGNDRSAVTFDLDLESAGYRRIDQDFENGLHGGQDASPQKIGKSLRAMGITRYIFEIDSVGQFDLDFSVWIHKSQKRKFKPGKLYYRADRDPARVMQEGLRNASLTTAALQQQQKEAGGVIVSKLQPDGTAVTKLVSPQDFIEGKALD